MPSAASQRGLSLAIWLTNGRRGIQFDYNEPSTQGKTDEEIVRGPGRPESASDGSRIGCPMRRSFQGNRRDFGCALLEVRRDHRFGQMLRGRCGGLRGLWLAQGVARLCREVCGARSTRRACPGLVRFVPDPMKRAARFRAALFAVWSYCSTAPMSAGPTRRW